MARTTPAATELLRKHAPDPLRELLEDVQDALGRAETPADRRAISVAAAEALDAIGLAGDDDAVTSLAQLTDPNAVQAERVQVVDDEFRGTGRSVSLEEWAAEDAEFGQVLKAVRSAKSSAVAAENLDAVRSLGWDNTSAQLLELLTIQVAENDDGSAAAYHEAKRTEESLRIWKEATAAQEAEAAEARKLAVFEEAFAAKAAEMEGTQTDAA
jgi:hypothetical protein